MIGRDQIVDMIEKEGVAARVLITRTQGSTPREAGVFLVVAPSGGFRGTIGGGALEWELMLEALEALRAGESAAREFTRVLGPDLGQCCGGRVAGRIDFFTRADLLRLHDIAEGGSADIEAHVVVDPPTPLLLFGAGHVGRALVLALAGLPFSVRWIDPRADMFPAFAPRNAAMAQAVEPVAEVARAPAGSFALVMTHSHALDFDIVAAALTSDCFDFVGLIGSATKRARFLARLHALGISPDRTSRLVCPIGVPGLHGKAPAIIAASTAAQLLMCREQARRAIMSAPAQETPSPPRRVRGEAARDRHREGRRRSRASALES